MERCSFGFSRTTRRAQDVSRHNRWQVKGRDDITETIKESLCLCGDPGTAIKESSSYRLLQNKIPPNVEVENDSHFFMFQDRVGWRFSRVGWLVSSLQRERPECWNLLEASSLTYPVPGLE